MRYGLRLIGSVLLGLALCCAGRCAWAETDAEATLRSALNANRKLETVFYLYTVHESGAATLYDEAGQPCGVLPNGCQVALTDRRQENRTFVLYGKDLSGWVDNEDLAAQLPDGVNAREAAGVSYQYVLADDRLRDLFTPAEIYRDAERTAPCGSLVTGTLVAVYGWQEEMAHFTLGALDAWIPAFNLIGPKPAAVNQAMIAAQIERAQAYAEAQKTAYSGGAVFYVATGNDDPLRLRAAPSADAETLGRYRNGTPVTVQEDENGWVRVAVDGQEGYMMRKYLAAADETDLPAGQEEVMVVHTGNKAPLKMRAKPDGKADVLGTYANGTRVTVHLRQNDWAYVTAGDQSGYMMLKYLIPAED